MTREEHIENLKAIASDMPSDKCSDWIESLMAGVKALEQVSSSEKPNKWILCKDRLPDKLKDVLIAFADAPDEYEIAYLKTTDNATYKTNGAVNEWMTFAGASYADYEVDAWMPLPEPYQPEIPTGAEGREKE